MCLHHHNVQESLTRQFLVTNLPEAVNHIATALTFTDQRIEHRVPRMYKCNASSWITNRCSSFVGRKCIHQQQGRLPACAMSTQLTHQLCSRRTDGRLG